MNCVKQNCTSYAGLVIKPKPQRQMGQQRFGCQGVQKDVASLVSHPSSLDEESGSISIESGDAVRVKV
jgi:hypothetical protein